MFYLGRVSMQDFSFDPLPEWLSVSEKRHAEGLLKAKRRLSWLAGRLAAKEAAIRCLKEKNLAASLSDIEIFAEASGVPVIGGPVLAVYPEAANWRISISHSHPWAIAALSDSPSCRAIGIDVERVASRRRSWQEIAFHPEEESFRSENPWVYTCGWTVKEAVLKALGAGLSVDLWDVRLKGNEVTLLGQAMKKFKELGFNRIEHGSQFDGDWVFSWAVAK